MVMAGPHPSPSGSAEMRSAIEVGIIVWLLSSSEKERRCPVSWSGMTMFRVWVEVGVDGAARWRQRYDCSLTQKSNTNSIRRGVNFMWGTKKGGEEGSLGRG